jgi:hypothetical protein
MPAKRASLPSSTDYHSKPVFAIRVAADLRDWAKDEAKRRGQGVGDFLEDVLSAERDRVVNHVVNHPPVAVEDEQPPAAGKNCKHKNMKLGKGVCPDCNEWVTR